MPREPDPINDPELFDAIELDGRRSPGVVTLSGHDDKVGWDVKAGSGQKGASMTRKGAVPPEFKASFFLADGEDIAAWPAFRDLINSTTGKTTKALDIYHPDLAEVGIKSVVKATIHGAKHDGKGGQTREVTFQVYAPPVKATGTVKAKDPNQAALDELDALTKTYNNTPWSGPETDALGVSDIFGA